MQLLSCKLATVSSRGTTVYHRKIVWIPCGVCYFPEFTTANHC